MAGIIEFFIPKEKKFFDMLKTLSGHTKEGASLFLRLVEQYDKLPPEKRAEIISELEHIEHYCDELTHRISIELNRTFITPIDREDIHRLSTLTDDLMDIILNISHKLKVYNIKKIPKYMPELARISGQCTDEIDILMSKLGTKEKVGMNILRIHRLEKKADDLLMEALAYLFNDSIKAIDTVKLKDIYELLEAISDVSEDIADMIENIVIKYA